MLLPIGLLSLVLFAELGILTKNGPLPIDERVSLWFKEHRTAEEVQWAQVISALTTPIIVFAVIVVILLYLNYWIGSWYLRDFIPLALVISCAAIDSVAKVTFSRLRPGPGLSTLFDLEPSYPSSHTVFIAAAGGALLIFAGRRQFLILIGMGLATCFVGLVRLTLGIHWVTDIFGSMLLTFGMLILFYVADDWLAEKESNHV